MARSRELDPSASVAAYFGAELRRYRVAADLTQERLGEVINYTGALIGLVETAKRTPTREFAERCDVALGTDGALIRLWPLLRRATFPAFVRQFVELEATATQVRSFECQLVPGLLQTPDYARAVLAVRGSHPTADVLDEAVSARISRQALLTGSPAPTCWFVLDEADGPTTGCLIVRASSKHSQRLESNQSFDVFARCLRNKEHPASARSGHGVFFAVGGRGGGRRDQLMGTTRMIPSTAASSTMY